MTENEVIKKLDMLDEALNFQRHDADECSCALQMAIQALEEIQRYREIGTVEECRVAVERRKPRKATDVRYFGEAGYYIGLCPSCNSVNNSEYQYCGNCGQAIDW